MASICNCLLPNGGIELVGEYKPPNDNDPIGLIVRLSASGELVQTFGFQDSHPRRGEIPASAAVNGGRVYVGMGDIEAMNGLNGVFQVFKIDDAGELVWSWGSFQKVAVSGLDSRNVKILEDADNNIWILGVTGHFTESRLVTRLLKLTPNGGILFSREYLADGAFSSNAVSMVLNDNGGATLLLNILPEQGGLRQNGFIHLDANGNVLEAFQSTNQLGSRYSDFRKSTEQPGFMLTGFEASCTDSSLGVTTVARVDEDFTFGGANCDNFAPLSVIRNNVGERRLEDGVLIDLEIETVPGGALMPAPWTALDLTCPVLTQTTYRWSTGGTTPEITPLSNWYAPN
ncbi:NHL repeat-containing protein [Neolewinella persica]|uniref:hypothetical protein n=1 Tax=Neolewinella persica TaxID=70998 RepID=UPI00037DB769|nr:hypothetical protein [Neolewinella persica]